MEFDSIDLIGKTVIPKNAHSVLVFDLPFSIPIPDGLYPVRISTRIAEISVERIQRQTVGGWTNQGGGSLQMRLDKYGRSSFSHIELKLPWVLDFSENGRTPILLKDVPPRRKAKETALRYLNRFIEVVRYVTGEYWVEPARYQDILSYEAFYWDGKKRYSAGLTLLETGVGGLVVGNVHPYQLEKEKSDKLNDILTNESELDASKVFILNAKDSCLQEDFRLAMVETVTALEIVLYRFIRLQGKKMKIRKEDLEHFIIDVGLTGNIDVVLRMLTHGLEQIGEGTIRTCKGAIRIRNKILHEGLRDISSTDTEKRVIAVEQMIAYLEKLIVTL